jgi:hypothetical protein
MYNIYNPPNTKLNLKLRSDLKRTVIAGDANGHTPLLDYKDRHSTKAEIEELTNSSTLILLQSSNTPPTLLHRFSGVTSRQDISLVYADIHSQTSMRILDDIGSDHRPILMEILTNTRKKTNTYPLLNNRKADWDKFRKLVSQQFQLIDLTLETDSVYKNISTAILQSAKEAIPVGRRTNFKPYWNKDFEAAVKERKKARRQVEKHPQNSKLLFVNVKRQVSWSRPTHKRDARKPL